MKKLVIDINSTLSYYTLGQYSGIGRTTRELVQALNDYEGEIDFEISLFSQNTKNATGALLNTHFKATHVNFPNRPGFKKLFNFLPVKELLLNYDLMHIPHNYENVSKPQKSIFTLHDALFMKMNENEFDHLNMRLMVPRMMEKCKGIITCSNSSKKDIVETMNNDPEKIEVVYWGINNEVFFHKNDKEDVIRENKKFGIKRAYFLSVSCNAERKNTHELVKAYLKLCQNSPKNDLVLIWSNPPEDLIQLINKSGHASRIHFLKNISDETLSNIYNGATALFFPSSYEGFGLPILEAMACGCPVVTCLNSSLPEVGGNAAVYIKEGIAEMILPELENFENNKYDNCELNQKGLLQAAKFNWKATANAYMNVYNKYLKQ